VAAPPVAPASLGQPAPFLPPQPGHHHAGRTVLPRQPGPAAPVVAPPSYPATSPVHEAVQPVPAGPAAVPAGEPSPLEAAARELTQAAAQPVPQQPVPQQPLPPATAAACMTILPG
jgi:hypothetical protein